MSHQMLSTKITRYNTTRNLYFNYGPWLPKFLPSLFGRCPLAIVYINLEPGAISDTLSGVLAGLLNTNTKPKVFWARNRSGMKPNTF